MGLFDKIFNEVPEEDKLSKQEAFAGIALAMAGADGSIKGLHNRLYALCIRYRLYRLFRFFLIH